MSVEIRFYTIRIFDPTILSTSMNFKHRYTRIIKEIGNSTFSILMYAIETDRYKKNYSC